MVKVGQGGQRWSRWSKVVNGGQRWSKTLDHLRSPLTTSCHLWRPLNQSPLTTLTTVDQCWPPLTSFDLICPLFTTFDHLWPPLDTFHHLYNPWPHLTTPLDHLDHVCLRTCSRTIFYFKVWYPPSKVRVNCRRLEPIRYKFFILTTILPILKKNSYNLNEKGYTRK